MDSYKITFETWNKIASIYQAKFMDLDLYDDTYDWFCREIEKANASVLEIGCGPGNITRYLFKKKPELKITAIDVAPNMIKLAKENNPAADFKVMDCREIDRLTEKYDAIMCGFCMPYLSREDCAKLIKDCSVLLNRNGIIYFSTIEGDYKESGYEAGSSGDKSYVYYHSESHLLSILKENEFELLVLERKRYPKTAEAISCHMIFIARKQ
jgi:2-polyprenyl-3-methyl-5-hydroxy-6-metoxy-1,4-benzoquinol methylase